MVFFRVGSKFTKMYRFTDINYLVASREDKESMFPDLFGTAEQSGQRRDHQTDDL